MHRCVIAVALLLSTPAVAQSGAPAPSPEANEPAPALVPADERTAPAASPTDEAPPSAPAPAAPAEQSITAQPIEPSAPAPAAAESSGVTPAPATPASAHVPNGQTVYLRFAPAGLAVFGRSLGDVQAPFFPDLVEIGVGLGKFDASFVLRAQSPFASRGEFSATLPSVALSYRPLREKALGLVDFYFQGSFAVGGVGQLVEAPSCDQSRLLGGQKCGEGHDGTGVGASLGIGIEFNLKLGEVPGGQLAFLTLGLELRGHDVVSFRTIAPSSDTTVANNLFGVVAIPIGVRFE